MIQKEKQPPAYPENWKELDHPFFNLVKDILHGKGAAVFYENEALESEEDFWGENPPEEIVIATGSTRKALMLSSVLNGVEIPFAHPMDFQAFMIESIHNGDGALKKKTFLGKFHGVPVFADSAADGETPANNPQREAINKATWLAQKPEYLAGNVLIISTDTVDFVDTDGNGHISDGEEGLGKPMNHPNFPQKNALMNSKISFIRFIGKQILQKQRERFQKQYVAENFVPGIDIIHTNAIALLDILGGDNSELIRVWEVLIQSTISDDFLEKFELVPDQGGGGASQQNHNWESVEDLFSSLDPETQNVLRSTFETDPEFFKFLVIFQIAGMPAVSILKEIENFAQKRKTPKEVVVFQSEES